MKKKTHFRRIKFSVGPFPTTSLSAVVSFPSIFDNQFSHEIIT